MEKISRVLFLGKEDDLGCKQALEYLHTKTDDIVSVLGTWDEPLPSHRRAEVMEWRGDLLISYLCRWIIPQSVSENASRFAINFHPGSPEYPGAGCNNFALYEDSPTYGPTCHHIVPVVDSGPIIATRTFPVDAKDSVATLLQRTYDEMYEMYTEVIDGIFDHGTVPDPALTWTGRTNSRKGLRDLMAIEPDMSAEEVAKRIRATSFGQWQPSITLHGHRFIYEPESGE